MPRFSTGRLPKVWVEVDDVLRELHCQEILITHTDDRGFYEQLVEIKGVFLEAGTSKTMTTTTYPPDPLAIELLPAKEPINLGGIPPTVLLRCPRCDYTDHESTHECRSE